jgi:hypothetical protein
MSNEVKSTDERSDGHGPGRTGTGKDMDIVEDLRLKYPAI